MSYTWVLQCIYNVAEWPLLEIRKLSYLIFKWSYLIFKGTAFIFLGLGCLQIWVVVLLFGPPWASVAFWPISLTRVQIVLTWRGRSTCLHSTRFVQLGPGYEQCPCSSTIFYFEVESLVLGLRSFLWWSRARALSLFLPCKSSLCLYFCQCDFWSSFLMFPWWLKLLGLCMLLPVSIFCW